MDPWPRIERLWRDVGDDSPWHEKALWHAVVALKEQSHIRACNQALDWIENDLRDRPQEIDPSIYEREADALLALVATPSSQVSRKDNDA